MIDPSVIVEGHRQVQAVLNSVVRQMKGGLLERTQNEMAVTAAELAADVSPVVTGTLASSHIVKPLKRRAIVFINAIALNPLGGASPADYGPIVHQLGGVSGSGGKRQFYAHVESQFGTDILRDGAESIARNLELC